MGGGVGPEFPAKPHRYPKIERVLSRFRWLSPIGGSSPHVICGRGLAFHGNKPCGKFGGFLAHAVLSFRAFVLLCNRSCPNSHNAPTAAALNLTLAFATSTLRVMEVHLNRDQLSKLAQLANEKGRAADILAQEAISRYLEEEARFIEAVKLGEVELERGNYLTHEEVGARVERLLKS